MTVSDSTPTPGRQGDRMIALTPWGHLALVQRIYQDRVQRVDGVVWVPVVRLPWYQDKRKDGAL